MTYPTIKGITSSIIAHYYSDDDVCYVLLGKRKDNAEAFPNCWCLPGGFLEPNIETLEQCAVRELREETGLETDPSMMRLITIQSDPSRDPRGHIIDTVWACLFDRNMPLNGTDDIKPESLAWFDIEETPTLDLAFDHEQSLYLFAVQEDLV